MTDKDFDQR